MKILPRSRLWVFFLGLFGLLAACGSQPVTPTAIETYEFRQRAPNVPELPFADNPDPSLCGIPTRWGKEDPAWLSGYYEGELVQTVVYLYDSHLRYEITGAAPTGTPVKILFYQENPQLDYYLVETIELEEKQSGWVPAPFLSFDPVSP
jgi:hypothetical protein